MVYINEVFITRAAACLFFALLDLADFSDEATEEAEAADEFVVLLFAFGKDDLVDAVDDRIEVVFEDVLVVNFVGRFNDGNFIMLV